MKIEGLETLVALEELYLSHNGITSISGLEHNVSFSLPRLHHLRGLNIIPLHTTDQSHDAGRGQQQNYCCRCLCTCHPCPPRRALGKLRLDTEGDRILSPYFGQANDNELIALPLLPPSSHPELKTIYLEGNPIMKSLAGNYRRKVMLEMPQVIQIDAGFVGKRA